jgi:hypothetical protein
MTASAHHHFANLSRLMEPVRLAPSCGWASARDTVGAIQEPVPGYLKAEVSVTISEQAKDHHDFWDAAYSLRW